jgi:hypothetical protein
MHYLYLVTYFYKKITDEKEGDENQDVNDIDKEGRGLDIGFDDVSNVCELDAFVNGSSGGVNDDFQAASDEYGNFESD